MLKRLKPLFNKIEGIARGNGELNQKQINKRLGIANYGLLKERTIRPPLRKGL